MKNPILALSFLTLVVACTAIPNSQSSPNPEETLKKKEPKPTYSTIETYMGTGTAGLGEDGVPLKETKLYSPQDLTFGPDGRAYILDWNNHRVRVVEGDTSLTLMGTGELGDATQTTAKEMKLNHPTHISFDPQGRMIVAAWHNSKILRMDLKSEVVETIVGDGSRDFRGENSPAKEAWLDLPIATAFDKDGNMYISDQQNQRIRKVDTKGIISTFAGTGTKGFRGDGGPAKEAELAARGGQAAAPSSRISFDSKGNLFIADTGNNRVRKITPDGLIKTVVGSGSIGQEGDGGPAIEATLNRPMDIAFDSKDNLYIADTFNSCIRKVDENGIISTFVGTCSVGGIKSKAGQSRLDLIGDGGSPLDAQLFYPFGITFDKDDNLYIADTHNHLIRVVKK